MNCSCQLFLIYLISVHFILCYSTTILASNASLATSGLNHGSARYKRQSECPCQDADKNECAAETVCKCETFNVSLQIEVPPSIPGGEKGFEHIDQDYSVECIDAVSDFCRYKIHFGRESEKHWGVTMCVCPTEEDRKLCSSKSLSE